MQAAFKEAKAKKRGEDYRVVEEDGKKVAVILVDGVIPKVRACMHRTGMVACMHGVVPTGGVKPDGASPWGEGGEAMRREVVQHALPALRLRRRTLPAPHACAWCACVPPLLPPTQPPPASPQGRRAALWLSCLNYQLSDDNLPIAESPFATVCTPYVFNKYRGIFGLSGSIGGQAELTYLASTYGAVKFEVP